LLRSQNSTRAKSTQEQLTNHSRPWVLPAPLNLLGQVLA